MRQSFWAEREPEATLSQVIDQQRVVDLPLNGRNAAALMMLAAGVADATNEGNGVNQSNGKTFSAAVVMSTNGTLPNQSITSLTAATMWMR